MALTRSFRETVVHRARHDVGFRLALFEEALQALLDGQVDEARSLLRDCINATIGFDALAESSGIPPKSLMRMVGPQGNPTLRNFVVIVQAIQNREGIRAQAQVFNPEAPSINDLVLAASTRESAATEAQVAGV